MLTKNVCRFDDKKNAVKWLDVPVEKEDILEYIKIHIETLERYFIYHKTADFFDQITFLRHIVLAFGDLDIITAQEIKGYLLKYHEFCDRYLELKKL